MNSSPLAHRLIPLTDVLDTQHPHVVARIAKEVGVTAEQAEALLADVKTFLYLAALTGKSLTPSIAIDDAWHQFILFTRDYEAFCKDYFGRFMHHQPGGKGEVFGRDLIEFATAVLGIELSQNWGSANAGCTPDSNCESAPSDCALN